MSEATKQQPEELACCICGARLDGKTCLSCGHGKCAKCAPFPPTLEEQLQAENAELRAKVEAAYHERNHFEVLGADWCKKYHESEKVLAAAREQAATARREALEEAIKATCFRCERDGIPEDPGSLHGTFGCYSLDIRELLAANPQPSPAQEGSRD